jgi:hypothetical protein
MGIYEFNILELEQQKELVLKDAIFLTNRLESNMGLSLYRLFDFYTEVHLNNDTNEIEKIRTFKSIEQLDPYLNEIDLTELGN